MSAGSRSKKKQEWTDRFVRFENSQQTVTEFCRSECVSQPSFYVWRKKLGLGKRLSKRPKRRRPIVQPQSTPLSNGLSREHTNFRPVSLTNASTDPLPKVRLPGGIELELGSDVQLVQSIVKQLVQSTTSELEAPRC